MHQQEAGPLCKIAAFTKQRIDSLPTRQLTGLKDQLLKMAEVGYETAERAKGCNR